MRPLESQKCRKCADRIWELAEEARSEEMLELAETLKQISTALHAKASGRANPFDG